MNESVFKLQEAIIDDLREENNKLKEKLKRINEYIELINLVDFTEHNCLILINKIEEILKGDDKWL
mgnify:CR=1 FL=1